MRGGRRLLLHHNRRHNRPFVAPPSVHHLPITRPPTPKWMLLRPLYPLQPSSVATRPMLLLRSLVPSGGHKLLNETSLVAGKPDPAKLIGADPCSQSRMHTLALVWAWEAGTPNPTCRRRRQGPPTLFVEVPAMRALDASLCQGWQRVAHFARQVSWVWLLGVREGMKVMQANNCTCAFRWRAGRWGFRFR